MNAETENVEIRPFTAAHLDEQLKLDVTKAKVTVSPILEEGMRRKNEFWKEVTQEEEFLGFMAHYRGEPAGFINLLRASLIRYLFAEFKRSDALHVENKCLYVPPPYVEEHPQESKKIYDALLSAATKYAKENGFIGISGIAWQDGVYRPDRSTYERHGFKVVHEFPEFKIYAVASYPVKQLNVRYPKVRKDLARVITFGLPSCPFSLAAKAIAEKVCHTLPNVEYEYIDVWKNPKRALELGFPGTGPLTIIDGEFLYWAANVTHQTLRQKIVQHLKDKGLW
ncbi:MAG: hypothetical protein GWO20_09440 [Candidatus Korarchaeota archaeon]|nr:hypothetical protein [Candidatus Korarchaeota archaeon]NIU83671.1 hypothetical protein [Candidatus Thorarchaeota archaeon]NIW13889.1 hypothetical protein [Candidatus Thorarchaeota archaeon]NIW51995.1 hypothetical protein [Candidatus Korarchaeota archaeon]